MAASRPNKKSRIILGIDPGLADTGFGVIEQAPDGLRCLEYGSIRTGKDRELADRLIEINRQLSDIIDKYRPELACVEQLFFCTNVKTALLVGQARGVVLLTLAQKNLPHLEFTPLQIKQAITGYGAADKKQMQQMVKMILNLREIPKPDDAADALAMAVCAANCRIIDKTKTP